MQFGRPTLQSGSSYTELRRSFPSQTGVALSTPVDWAGIGGFFDVQVIDKAAQEIDDERDKAMCHKLGSMMLEYWGQAKATTVKFRGNWLLAGDRQGLSKRTKGAGGGGWGLS